MLKVTPILDRILIKQDEGAEKIGVFFVPESAREKPRQGTVVAIGPGLLNSDGKYLPMMTKVGDKVVYGEYAGHEISVDGEKFIIVKEGELLLIL